MVKNLPAREMWVQSLVQEDPLGGGKSNPLQYSCLENSMNRGASWATVHGVAKSWMRQSSDVITNKDQDGDCILIGSDQLA